MILIDFLPIWILFPICAGLLLLVLEIGYRVGGWVRERGRAERESTVSTFAGVILGLQSFMLAFTFGIVSDRYDSKKAMVRQEANHIRTAWERTDFLNDADRAKSRAILMKYVDERLSLIASRDLHRAPELIASARGMQRELWAIAVANKGGDLNSEAGALYFESLDELETIHASRVALGLYARIPTSIWLVLVVLLIAGMFGIGYHASIADSRRSRVAPILAVSFTLVLALIAALDHPGDTLVPISQKPLVDIRAEMNTEGNRR